MGIHAALRKDGEEWIIDPDRGHAGETVSGQVRRQAHIAERWVIVTFAGRIHAVHAEAAREKRSRSNGPVVLRAAILDVREVNRAVTLITADDRRRSRLVVVTAVTPGDSVLGIELVIYLDVELPTGVGTDNDFALVEIRINRALY